MNQFELVNVKNICLLNVKSIDSKLNKKPTIFNYSSDNNSTDLSIVAGYDISVKNIPFLFSTHSVTSYQS